MTVKELKEMIKNTPDDYNVIISYYYSFGGIDRDARGMSIDDGNRQIELIAVDSPNGIC